MEEINKKIIEEKVLIARRQPPSDRWRLISDEPDGIIHKSLTDTLEAYMVKTGFKGNYRLEPLQSKLYAIQEYEYEIPKEEPKSYSIYGELNFKQGM